MFNWPSVGLGIVEAERMGMGGNNGVGYMPHTALRTRLTGDNSLTSITVRLKDGVDSRLAEKAPRQLLEWRHGARDFNIFNSDQIRKSIERTREIGLRMAVGARQSDIMIQFLIEAVAVCMVGAAAGLAIAFGLSALFNAMQFGLALIITPGAILLALLSTMLISLIFGFLPACKAARLDPVDALSRD